MILGFDIGNTNICPIFYSDNGEIIKTFRISTKLELTEDMLFSIIKNLADNSNINIYDIKDIIISSVVPHLNEVFIFLSKKYFNIVPKYVSLKYLTDHDIFIPNGKERGADRIVDILAAKKLFGNRHVIIIDFGTATTFDVIKDNIYLGGAILPGINLSSKALFENTAKLPKVRFEKPESFLAIDTISQINVGIYYSTIGAIREMIKLYKENFNDSIVIATGGLGKQISEDLDEIDEYIPFLGEKGIFEYYKIMLSLGY